VRAFSLWFRERLSLSRQRPAAVADDGKTLRAFWAPV
jgi:hypothetical protein